MNEELVLSFKELSFLSDAVMWHRHEQQNQIRRGMGDKYVLERRDSMERIERFLEQQKSQFNPSGIIKFEQLTDAI